MQFVLELRRSICLEAVLMRHISGIPQIGLGTWLRTGDAGYRALMEGIELGYHHLDTAQSYDTEVNVGRAVRECGLPRDALFVVTKVGHSNLSRRRFLPSLQESLRRMRLDRVDLVLVHWPAAPDTVPFEDYMDSLALAKASGLTRMIGVSNYTIDLIRRSVALLGPGEIVTNQVELHPYLQSRRLREACRHHGVTLTAYMPLAKGKVSDDPTLRRIGAAHDVSAASATLAWLLQHDLIVIPASGSRAHMEANLAAASLDLSDAEMTAIDDLDRHERMINPASAPSWDDPP